MGSALRTLAAAWHMSPEAISAIIDGTRHAPPPLSESELAGLDRELANDAPPHTKGDYPEWLQPEFERAFSCKPGQPMVAEKRCRVW